MKQGEMIVAPCGTGAVTIVENSNFSDSEPLPTLRIVMPGEDGVIVNGGCADQAVVNYPARSIELFGYRVRQLYDFLKRYYGEKHISTK